MTQQKIDFSIRKALNNSWDIFVQNPKFYLILGFVFFIFNFFIEKNSKNTLLLIIIFILSLFWSYAASAISISITNNQNQNLDISSIQNYFPSIKQVLFFVLVGITSGIVILGGFIMLIIPGIYFIIRLTFSNMSYVDKQEGIIASLRNSWNLTNNNFWTVSKTLFISLVFFISGSVFYGLVISFTYPIAILIMAQLYNALSRNNLAEQSIVEQPLELES